MVDPNGVAFFPRVVVVNFSSEPNGNGTSVVVVL